MTDPILDTLARTEHVLTTYLRDPEAGLKALEPIQNPGELQLVVARLLEFIAAQYKMQMVDLLAAGQPVDLSMETTTNAIHIGFMELREMREQEIGAES